MINDCARNGVLKILEKYCDVQVFATIFVRDLDLCSLAKFEKLTIRRNEF